jgi:hypothetical protein
LLKKLSFKFVCLAFVSLVFVVGAVGQVLPLDGNLKSVECGCDPAVITVYSRRCGPPIDGTGKLDKSWAFTSDCSAGGGKCSGKCKWYCSGIVGVPPTTTDKDLEATTDCGQKPVPKPTKPGSGTKLDLRNDSSGRF